MGSAASPPAGIRGVREVRRPTGRAHRTHPHAETVGRQGREGGEDQGDRQRQDRPGHARCGPDHADDRARRVVKIYTRKGDDGTTGLLYGGRVRKDSAAPAAYGDVDEAQAALGLARALAAASSDGRGGELDSLLVRLERDLWVLMAELATDPANRAKLQAGTSLVAAEMVEAVGPII